MKRIGNRFGARFAMLAAAVTVAVAGCSSVPLLGGSKPAPAPAAAPSTAPIATPTPAAPAAAPGSVAKGPRLSRGSINLNGDCNQREVDGFEENAQVSVTDSRIRNLTWRMRIGRRGTCSFDGEDFRQTRSVPNIELMARDGSGCKLMMWADPRRVTLAHNNCAKFCTAGVYDKAWPVMFDPSSGKCANNNR